MSYKQLLPVSGYSVSYLPADLSELDSLNGDLNEAKLLICEYLMEAGVFPRRVNWNAVLGIALATVMSAGIWAGIGFAIAQIW
jgi:hypothetical protein